MTEIPESPAGTETSAPAATAPDATAPETPDKNNSDGNLPWWIWLALLVLFGICLTAIIVLLVSKDRLEKRLLQAERLSTDEEEAYLKMNTNALYDAAKAANPPKTYGIEDIEDLDEVLKGGRDGQ